MRAKAMLVIAVLALGLIGGSAWARRGDISHHLLAWPGYETQWQKGIGIPDGTKSQQGLFMEKVEEVDNTDPPVGSGVAFTGVEGKALTALGYEIKDGGVCGVFPRFRVRVPHGDPDTRDDDWNYLFECHAGTRTASSEGWTTVSFSDTHAIPATAGAPALTFGTTISSLGLLFHLDSGLGFTTLDNINVSGHLIGRPGH